jgi:hypothetical protein
VNTPVFVLVSTCRSTSDLAAAIARYAVTASAGLAAPPRHASGVPCGHAPGTIFVTRSCSGASTMYVAPNSVSGRVVKTVIAPWPSPPTSPTEKSTRAPSDRPIQLRCCSLIASGQSSRSRSASSRSPYAVIRIIHWRSFDLNTGKLPRSERPSAVTSSLDSTVPRPGHQLTETSLA